MNAILKTLILSTDLTLFKQSDKEKNVMSIKLDVYYLVNIISFVKLDFWMGGSDDQAEGSWVWSADGSGLVYTNWYPNEPNNSDDSGENCLELSALYHWYWNDANCKKVLFQFICEKG